MAWNCSSDSVVHDLKVFRVEIVRVEVEASRLLDLVRQTSGRDLSKFVLVHNLQLEKIKNVNSELHNVDGVWLDWEVWRIVKQGIAIWDFLYSKS
jgi:hypothetical protein